MGLPSPKDPDYWEEDWEYRIEWRDRSPAEPWSEWHRIQFSGLEHITELVAKSKAAAYNIGHKQLTVKGKKRQYRVVQVQHSCRVVSRYE